MEGNYPGSEERESRIGQGGSRYCIDTVRRGVLFSRQCYLQFEPLSHGEYNTQDNLFAVAENEYRTAANRIE